jgi:competence protein ComEC
MVGLTPSVLRACLMLAMLLLAPLFGRESDPPTSLSFALFLILLANPCAAKSVSLQLSFGAMAGLLWLSPQLYRRIAAKKRSRAARFVLGSLAATAGALVLTAPLTAFYFNSLALIAPLSNLLCLWAASLTFALGLPAALAGLAFVPLGRILAYLPHWGALYLLHAAGVLTRVPHHAIGFSDGSLRLWLVYVYAMLAVCLIARRSRFRWTAFGGLAALSLALTLWLNAMPLRGGSLHVVALDVGQGQSVVLYSKGAAAIVDCGSKSYVSAGGVTADYLRGAGVGTLDCVVLSHYHSDHCNGLPVLFSRVRVKRLLLPDVEAEDGQRERTIALAERYGVPVTFVRETQTVPLGDAVLTVYPPVSGGDANEECLAAVCTTGSFDALFTADMGTDAERLLAAAYPLPDAEIMMAGHHGSRWSNGADLLAAARPELCVVSCGADNGYGHPHREALRRMADAGAAVCRTDLQGTIHITVN